MLVDSPHVFSPSRGTSTLPSAFLSHVPFDLFPPSLRTYLYSLLLSLYALSTFIPNYIHKRLHYKVDLHIRENMWCCLLKLESSYLMLYFPDLYHLLKILPFKFILQWIKFHYVYAPYFHYLFIHLLMAMRLSSFLAIVTRPVRSMDAQVYLLSYIKSIGVSQGWYSYYMELSVSVLKKSPQWFLYCLPQFTHPPAVNRASSVFPMSL